MSAAPISTYSSSTFSSSAIATLVMAAGESSRFEGCKLLAPVNGKLLLWRSIETAQQVTPGEVFVVTGAWHQQIADTFTAKQLNGVPLIYHPHWHEGLGSSIAAGVRELKRRGGYDAILILLADQIALTADDLTVLPLNATAGGISCAYYADRRGVPALFGRDHFDALSRLSGDKGAQQLLRATDAPVRAVAMPNAAFDIDTQQMLMDWLLMPTGSDSRDLSPEGWPHPQPINPAVNHANDRGQQS